MENGIKIELKAVSKNFKKTKIIKEMDLLVNPGEFLVLLGPSGCGKSTTLRMIAGLESVSAGEVLFDGKNAQKMTSLQKNIAMVFQDYALYPNMTVSQNLEYALKVHKVEVDVRKQRINKILKTLDLIKVANNYPSQLSGGQKQRTALGRGMIKQSRLFLLDEPLSNIDVQLREKARDEIQYIHQQNQQTIIYVTHDQTEAMALGDRIAVMDNGKIQMVATPDEIYNHPRNLFVAKFIGSPQINLIAAKVNNNCLNKGKLQLVNDLKQITAYQFQEEEEIYFGIRPENIQLTAPKKEHVVGIVTQITDYGRYQQIIVEIATDLTLKVISNDTTTQVGDEVGVVFNTDKILLFDTQNGMNLN
ncbi:ABC transporter ATP-binding protein [Ligilactobacillus sp. WILCCON 0076]|uniref:ABC transporter ATP-binding protein n=1 Tax=Ligilactobacillus ubinensis TaxID=2876789 RepID=A0A9X2JMA7_9LACO|nr:ABC transporter ATP-binding protein [Ligilactobacillus ubinensis]MCP0887833.1 ABC transporter ATP-binding protein [Ligilactobacillus ubinensis]